MRRLPCALVALLAVAPLAAATDPDMWVYADEEGQFTLGLVVADVEPVSSASFVVTPVENFTKLRFHLAFAPEGAEADTPAAFVALAYRMRVELSDQETGAALGAFDYDASGTRSVALEPGVPVRVDVSLVHGAGVDWTLRVTALPDPRPL